MMWGEKHGIISAIIGESRFHIVTAEYNEKDNMSKLTQQTEDGTCHRYSQCHIKMPSITLFSRWIKTENKKLYSYSCGSIYSCGTKSVSS